MMPTPETDRADAVPDPQPTITAVVYAPGLTAARLPDPPEQDGAAGPRGFVPAGREAMIERLGLTPGRRPVRGPLPWSSWAVFLVYLGPGSAVSLVITGYVAGAVPFGAVEFVRAAAPHAQVVSSAVGYSLGFLVLRERRASSAYLARAWRAIPAPGVAVAAVAILVPVWAAAADPGVRGASGFWLGVELGSLLLWAPLLLPEASGIAARLPGRAHAPAARRAALVSMAGLLATGTAGAAVFGKAFARCAPLSVLARMAASTGNGVAAPAPSWPAGAAQDLFQTVGNAVLEELVFAVLILALVRSGRSNRSVIALAGLLRISMHLYYGPEGIFIGAFGFVNAAALLRWRRLWPLIAMHALLDLIVDYEAAGYIPWMPEAFWPSVAAQCALPMAFAAALAAADALVRPPGAPA